MSQKTEKSVQTVWGIDPSHTQIQFAVTHMMFAKVKGQFEEFTGQLTAADDDWTSGQVEVAIHAASVNTAEADRDEHLRSADFFHVEEHPHITFVSEGIDDGDGDDAYAVSGKLTIRGVTQPVTLDARLTGQGIDPWGQQRIGFRAEAEVNRKDFGLEWNQLLEAGGVLVGDRVKLIIEAQLVRQEESGDN